MKYSRLFILLMLSFCSNQLLAQKSLLSGAWEINIPMSENYLTKTNFAGGKLEYRYFFDDHFYAGVAFNWNTYEEFQPRTTFTKPDGNRAITTDFIAEVYQAPLTLTAHYYFGNSKLFKPYAGLGVGAQYLKQTVYYNVYYSDDYNWGFVVRPEIGTIIKTEGTWVGLVGLSYSYATNKNEVLEKSNFSNLGITLGVGFMF